MRDPGTEISGADDEHTALARLSISGQVASGLLRQIRDPEQANLDGNAGSHARQQRDRGRAA
jgi:hypothetical protein